MGRKPHYFREWRKKAGLTQQRVADRIGRDKSIVSKLENFKLEYNQETLEALADAYGVEPPDLLRQPAQPPSELERYVRDLDERERDRALRVLRAAIERAA